MSDKMREALETVVDTALRLRELEQHTSQMPQDEATDSGAIDECQRLYYELWAAIEQAACDSQQQAGKFVISGEVLESLDYLMRQVDPACWPNVRMAISVHHEVRRILSNCDSQNAESDTQQGLSSVGDAQGGEAVAVCDGKEQEAFERHAEERGLDMSQHPLHYLFLSAATNEAREAWRAAIKYCVSQTAESDTQEGLSLTGDTQDSIPMPKSRDYAEKMLVLAERWLRDSGVDIQVVRGAQQQAGEAVSDGTKTLLEDINDFLCDVPHPNDGGDPDALALRERVDAALAAPEAEEPSIYEDVYEQITDLIEPHVIREGGNPEAFLPASAVESVRKLLDMTLAYRKQAGEPVALRYTGDRELAECPCCGSLDVGGVGGKASIEEGTAIVNCYACGLELRKKGTLKEACAAWNTRTGKVPQPHPADQQEWRQVLSELIDAMRRYETDVHGEADQPARHRAMMERAEALLKGSQPQPAVPEGLNRGLIAEMLNDYANALTQGDLDGAGHCTPADVQQQAEEVLAAQPQPDWVPEEMTIQKTVNKAFEGQEDGYVHGFNACRSQVLSRLTRPQPPEDVT